MPKCTDWNLIHEGDDGVSAWHSPSTGWLAVGMNPDWADSWIIGQQSAALMIQGQCDGFHSLEKAMDLWLAGWLEN